MPGTAVAGSKFPVRRWERYNADIPIRVIVQNEMKVTIFDGRGRSLNEGGMAVYVGTELRLGAEVAIEFTPAYAQLPIRVEARICNRNGYQYGLELLTVTTDQKQQAQEFRKHLATLAQPAES
jgi:hypothetical protein